MYHVTDCAFRKLLGDNEGVLVEGMTTITDPDVLFAYISLEEVVSTLLQNQPSLYHPVEVKAGRLSLMQSRLLRQASEKLVDFLLLDGQVEAADSYIQLAHDKFAKFKH